MYIWGFFVYMGFLYINGIYIELAYVFSWMFIKPAASTSLQKKCIYYKNQPAEDVVEVMDVNARGTTALGVSAWSLLVPLCNQSQQENLAELCCASALP